MEITRKEKMPVNQYNQLKALIAWYEAAPDEDFGDSFHMAVANVIATLMPQIPELDAPFPDVPTHYYDCPEIVDDKLVVDLSNFETCQYEIRIELVPEC